MNNYYNLSFLENHWSKVPLYFNALAMHVTYTIIVDMEFCARNFLHCEKKSDRHL